MPTCLKCLSEVEKVAPSHFGEQAGWCGRCLNAHFDAMEAESERKQAEAAPRLQAIVRTQTLCEWGVPLVIAQKIPQVSSEPIFKMGAKPWLVLQGVSGSGKTFRAVQILENTSASRRRFIDWPLFIEERKAAIGRDDEDPMEYALKSGLLVVDDLGGERQTEYSVDAAQLLFSDRYNRVASTIITTNLSDAQISERYGKRIASRIFEFSDVIEKTKQRRGAS